jgi:hypothetical protein
VKTIQFVAFACVITTLISMPAAAEVSEEVLNSISTPDEVKTSIGTLKFLDGAPLPETAENVYDYLDTMRAVDTFLKGMPGASLLALIEGAHSLGAVEAHEVAIFDELMDSKALFLTANTSTLYVVPDLDLKRDGPTVPDRWQPDRRNQEERRRLLQHLLWAEGTRRIRE